MKNLLTILFLLLFQISFCQNIQWLTGNEAIVKQYEVQQSADTLSWNTIGIVQPKGSGTYVFDLPAIRNYFRVKSTGDTNFYWQALLLDITTSNRVAISNAVTKTTTFQDKLTWSAANEQQVNYYLIERSINSGPWYQISRIGKKAIFSGNYSLNISRYGKLRSYRITPFYKDGTKGTAIVFN